MERIVNWAKELWSNGSFNHGGDLEVLKHISILITAKKTGKQVLEVQEAKNHI
jgi:hypothetical protein